MDTPMNGAQSGAPILDLQDESRHTAVGVVWRIYAAFIYPLETRRVLMTDGWVSWDDANRVYQDLALRFLRHGDAYGPFQLPTELEKDSEGRMAARTVATDVNWRDRNAVDRSQLSERRAQ